MTTREQLFAYCVTLLALVVVFIAALVAAAMSEYVLSKFEAFGLGTITGGLIGVLRLPAARAPVAQTDTGDINVKEKTDA